MTLFNSDVLDALTSAGVEKDKAMAVAVALTPQPPGSEHQPIIGDFAVFDALRAIGVADEKARHARWPSSAILNAVRRSTSRRTSCCTSMAW